MFDIFRKKIQDESIEEQLNDVKNYPDEFKNMILEGESCEEIPNAIGEFGLSATNPIPVNGIRGEIKYLSRLKTNNGSGLIFHRLGSISQQGFKHAIDVYEIVSLDMKTYDTLFFDMYHPRRSTKAPKGFTLGEYNKLFGKYAIGMGSTDFDEEFPNGLEKLMEKHYGSLGIAIYKKISQDLQNKKFNPPEKHKLKVLAVTIRIKKSEYTDTDTDVDVKEFMAENIYPFLYENEVTDMLMMGIKEYGIDDLLLIERKIMNSYMSLSTANEVPQRGIRDILLLSIKRRLEDEQKYK